MARWLLLASLLLVVSVPVHAFTAAQTQDGAKTYKRQCERCHGVNGQGKDNAFKGLRSPALIAPNALPCNPRPFQKIHTQPFRSAQDVYAFVSATMPADQPAILDEDEYWDVLASLLQASGTVADDTRLDATSSAQVALHPDCTSANSRIAEKAQP